MSMGGHQSHRMIKDEWLTPPWLMEKLGRFDLDPCAPIVRPWGTARHHHTILDDGLSRDWRGRVWLNPPYGKEAGKWLARLADHGQGTALIFARTETLMFHAQVWNKASALFFFEGRLTFHHVNGEEAKYNGGAPSVLVAYGRADADLLRNCNIKGKFIGLEDNP